MSGVRVLVGTRKGAFVLTSDGEAQALGRQRPALRRLGDLPRQGLAGRPGPALRVADQRLVRAGHPALRRRRQDLGAGRQRVQLRRTSRHAPVVRRHAAPVGVRPRLAPRAVARPTPTRSTPASRTPALFRSTDGGRAGRSCPACARTTPGRPGSRAPAGCACTRSSWIRAIAGADVRRPSRPRARSAVDDGGQTWRPVNRGLHSEGIPDPDAEVGHCVHRIAMHPSRPDVLYMQKHWDVMRSDDAGESWREVSGNLPTDFGFPIDVHAHEPQTRSTSSRSRATRSTIPPDGKLRVYRSRTGGRRVGAADQGPAAGATATSTCCATRWPWTRSSPAASTSAPPAGRSTPRPTPATAGRRSSATCPPCCRSRSRRCQ